MKEVNGKEKLTDDQVLIKAVYYTTFAHKEQFRKCGKVPYVVHPFRVYVFLARKFGIKDVNILAAALLHDVIEDTEKTYEDIKAQFGEKIADWVELLSRDKDKPEEAYVNKLKSAPSEVKLIKLADCYDNILDAAVFDPRVLLGKILRKSQTYLNAFSSGWKDPFLSEAMGEVLKIMIELVDLNHIYMIILQNHLFQMN